MSTPIYSESQRVRMWWIYVFCLSILGLALWVFIKQIILDTPVGNHPAPNWALYVILSLSLLLVVLVFVMQLHLRIDKKGVSVRYEPFLQRRYSWRRIQSVEVIEYDPMRDYGGWGIRHNWRQKSNAFTVAGHFGLSLTLTNGKKILIGTYKPEKLKNFLKNSGYLSS